MTVAGVALSRKANLLGRILTAGILSFSFLILPGETLQSVELPDVILRCYNCTITSLELKGDEDDQVKLEKRKCLDPRKHIVDVVECVNQLCMKITWRSDTEGYVLERGCAPPKFIQEGCTDFQRKFNDTDTYACFCASDECNSSPGLVLERDVPEIESQPRLVSSASQLSPWPWR